MCLKKITTVYWDAINTHGTTFHRSKAKKNNDQFICSIVVSYVGFGNETAPRMYIIHSNSNYYTNYLVQTAFVCLFTHVTRYRT